jgi:NhaP-type Na+/H+ or K+/H+ antiporter
VFGLALVAAFVFVYALVSRRLATTSVTGPMLFMFFGILIGPRALDVLTLNLDSNLIQIFLEGTLVIVLFTDAAVINYRAVRSEAFLPGRLLGIGLPLAIVSGTLAAFVYFDHLGIWQAAVIAVILSPTDAALGQAVVSNKSVPAMVRQGLSVESGLNDGIVVPFLTIALAGAASEMQTAAEIANVFLAEIGWAVLVGLLVGWIGAKAVKLAGQRGWMTRDWRLIAAPILALLAFALADPVGGSGFMAAFVAGITFGNHIRSIYPDICEFSEGVSHLLTVVAFLVFGALILGPSVEAMTWGMVVFAVVALTAVRMVPVAVSLIGTGLGRPSVLYIGWFGPRGLASLVFAGTAVVESDPAGAQFIVAVVSVTVAMSVVAHGMSAVPLSQTYAKWFRRMDAEDPSMPEADDVDHMPSSKRLNPPIDPH